MDGSWATFDLRRLKFSDRFVGTQPADPVVQRNCREPGKTSAAGGEPNIVLAIYCEYAGHPVRTDHRKFPDLESACLDANGCGEIVRGCVQVFIGSFTREGVTPCARPGQ